MINLQIVFFCYTYTGGDILKKLISVIMLFCLLASHVSAMPVISDEKYISAEASVSVWPGLPANAVPIFYGEDECLLLPAPGEVFVPVLYNTRSGKISELYAHKADTETWTEMALGTIMGYGIDYTQEELDYLLEAYTPMGLFFAGMTGMNYYEGHSLHDDVMLVKTRYAVLLIYLESAVMRPVDAYALLDDGSYVMLPEDDGGMYTVCYPNGSSADISYEFAPGFEASVTGLGFGHDSVALVAQDTGAKTGEPCAYVVGFLDGYESGNLSGFVSVGAYDRRSGPCEALVCGPSQAIVYNSSSLPAYPPVLADAAAGSALALVWNGESILGIPTDELIGESGMVSVKHVTDSYLYPLGTSDDGRYAAFIESGSGDLLIMDIATLSSRCVLTGAEIEAAGLSPMLASLVSWDGGSTITGKQGYHVEINIE